MCKKDEMNPVKNIFFFRAVYIVFKRKGMSSCQGLLGLFFHEFFAILKDEMNFRNIKVLYFRAFIIWNEDGINVIKIISFVFFILFKKEELNLVKAARD